MPLSNTVAQLLFTAPPALNFARLVNDLGAAFRNCPAEGRTLAWDHDDLAILDVQGSRIILGWVTDLAGAHRACLSVGVGHGPGPGAPGLAARQATVARMIVERVSGRYLPDAVLWHETNDRLDADLIDRLTEAQEPAPQPSRGQPVAEMAHLKAQIESDLASRAADPALAAVPALARALLTRGAAPGRTQGNGKGARLVMTARSASLTVARMTGQVYQVTRGRLERAADPNSLLQAILRLPQAGDRVRPRLVARSAQA